MRREKRTSIDSAIDLSEMNTRIKLLLYLLHELSPEGRERSAVAAIRREVFDEPGKSV